MGCRKAAATNTLASPARYIVLTPAGSSCSRPMVGIAAVVLGSIVGERVGMIFRTSNSLEIWLATPMVTTHMMIANTKVRTLAILSWIVCGVNRQMNAYMAVIMQRTIVDVR